MENHIVWLDVEILGEFKTEVVFAGPGTVGLVAVGDLVFCKPDQTNLLSLRCWVMAISRCQHISQGDQGSSAFELDHIDGCTTYPPLALPPEEGGEWELSR